MYGLRGINNMYSEHAGTRSDYIIVGHPEYQHGKVKSQSGFGSAWDTKSAVHPRKCLAASRSHGKLMAELTSPEPWVPLKERTLRKQQQKDASSGSSSPGGLPRNATTGMLHKDLHAFLEKLSTPEEEFQHGRTPRTPLSFAKSKRQATVCRHFAARHEEIDDIRMQFKQSPDATQRKLEESGAWKYYALQMEQDQRLRAQFQKDMQRLGPSVRKSHGTACGMPLGRTA